MKVYACLCNYDYEGSELDGIYTNLREAKKHHFSGGDSNEMQTWIIDKKGVGKCGKASTASEEKETPLTMEYLMPLLIKLGFTHYSPKDSQSGIKEYLIADNMDQALAYIDKQYLYDTLKDPEQEQTECNKDQEWVKANPHKTQQAKDLGLKVEEDEYGITIAGPANLLTQWHEGEDWDEDVTDAYYGVTQWNWRKQTIDPNVVATLKELGIVKDLRDQQVEQEKKE